MREGHVACRIWHFPHTESRGIGVFAPIVLTTLFVMTKPLALCLLCCFSLSQKTAWAADTIWNFANATDRFQAEAGGTGTLAYYDPNDDGWGPVSTQFATAAELDLPALPGGNAVVMQFPTCTAQQGYVLSHGGEPNGAYGETDGMVSNYTVIMDILYPAATNGQWRALWQTDLANSDDAEFYVQNTASSGIGISGNYKGSLKPDTWHRVAIVVRAAPGEGYCQRFIDGQFVGGYGTSGSAVNARWAVSDGILLFTDDGGETAGGYLSSLRFVDRAMTMSEIKALGGPHASGATVAGAPAPEYDYTMPRRVQAIGHRGGIFGLAPDNTLASVQAAIDAGLPVIEIDTRLSADGKVILLHDATIDRTTNGSGEAEFMTVAELKAFDAGSSFDPSFAGQKIPTLSEVMALAKGKLVLYFDLKVNGQIGAIKEAATETGFSLDDCWFWVYGDEAEAAAIREAVPNAKIVWEASGNWDTQPDYFSNLWDLGVRILDQGTYYNTINPAFVFAAKRAGFLVSCYTVLDPATMVANAAAGVDYMETDYGHIMNQLQPAQTAKASRPNPASGSTDLPTSFVCSWLTGQSSTSHRIYLGETSPGQLVGEQTYDLFSPPALRPGKTYYWRVDEVTPGGIVEGDVWSFSTKAVTDLSDASEWTLNGGLDAGLGAGVMEYASAYTEEITAFGTTDGATLPHIGGEAAGYMQVPAFDSQTEGYHLTFTGIGPNGGGDYLNQYSLIFDVLVPDAVFWLPFFQSAPNNPDGNDADFYLDGSNYSIGIGALVYSPANVITPWQWHRVGFIASLSEGIVRYYVDGVQVRERTGTSLRDGRFALYCDGQDGPDLLLFNEGDTSGIYTSELYVSSIAFVPQALTGAEMADLGAPKAAGIFVRGGTAPALPALQVAYSAPNAVFSWQAQPGVWLEKSSSLAPGSWQKINGTENGSTYSEPVTPGQPWFFRLAR